MVEYIFQEVRCSMFPTACVHACSLVYIRLMLQCTAIHVLQCNMHAGFTNLPDPLTECQV